MKFKKGFSSPPHIHNVTYRGVVIEGLVHNADPDAQMMWMPKGSFWTQPQGHVHITAASEKTNFAYIEIDSGPYLVKSPNEKFETAERPINVDPSNFVWLASSDIEWLEAKGCKVAMLYGQSEGINGTFLKLSANSRYTILSNTDFKAVVVNGSFEYFIKSQKHIKYELTPCSFFSSNTDRAKHYLETGNSEIILYIRSVGKYIVK